MNRARTLVPQLLIYTVAPLLLLLLGVAYGGLRLHQRAMRQMVGERDERAVRAAAAALEEQLERRAAATTSLALHAAAVDPALALADVAAFHDDFSGLALFATDGALLAANDPAWWRQPAIAMAVAEAVAGLPARGAPHAASTAIFAPLATDPATGRAVVLVVAAAGGAVAVGAFDPAVPAREVIGRVVLPGDNAAVYLAAPDGALLFQAGDLGGHGEAMTHPGVAEALRGEIGTTYLPVAGDEHVVSYTPVAPVGWALVLEEAWRAMSGPLLRGTELVPFVLLPVLAVAAAVLWFGARQVVQPLQRLAANTTALGRGEFDAITTPVGGIAEIRLLHGHLMSMARRLQMAQQGLRGYLGALTAGQEEERRRLARELHDETLQSLIALNQHIQLAQGTVVDRDTAAQLAQMEAMVAATMADLRRMTRDLRPSYLDDLGLAPALALLARDATGTLGLPVAFELSGEARRLSPEAELAYYRIAQEGLRNVGRHAQATRATVGLAFDGAATTLTISDDGVGFDATRRPAELAAGGHFGLLGAAERAEAAGARLSIDASPGHGTRLICILQGEEEQPAVSADGVD